MAPIPAIQVQDPRPLHSLLWQGELREVARRVGSAVAYFFQVVAQILANSWHQVTAIADRGLSMFEKFLVRTITLAGVPSEEKEAIMDLALRIAPRDRDYFCWRLVAQEISRIPAAERDTVVGLASPLLSDQTRGLDKDELIRAIGGVAAAEREMVIHLASLLITNPVDGWDNAWLIRAIGGIPADQKVEVVQFAWGFFTDQMDGYRRGRIIRAIGQVAGGAERAQVVRLALQLCTRQWIECGMDDIIFAVGRVPANQREDVVRHALRFITPQMNGPERADLIREIARLPADQRNHLVLAPRRGINVHAGNRDQKTREAIELLRRAQGNLSSRQMEQAQRAFIEYLDASPFNEADKAIVKRALFTPKEDLPPGDPRREPFGPLIDDEGFAILGLRMTGKEILARHWLYALSLPESRENHEQTNAKHGMIRALINCCLADGHRICNQGKTQHIAIAVLQGRLRGVNIEEDDSQGQIRTNVAMNMFFNTTDHQQIDQLAPLLEAANRFCDQNALVNREEFLAQIREYALQGQIQ